MSPVGPLEVALSWVLAAARAQPAPAEPTPDQPSATEPTPDPGTPPPTTAEPTNLDPTAGSPPNNPTTTTPVWPEDPPDEPPPPDRPTPPVPARPVFPEPEPEPEPTPPETTPTDGGDETPKLPVKAAPFADFDVADRGSELDLGGDLTLGPRCKDDELSDEELDELDELDEDEALTFVCSNYRLGIRAKLPVTQSSASGSGRAAIDSLNGFAGSWRVGAVFDLVRDVTSDDSDAPAKFYLWGISAGWGVQTFRFNPTDRPDTQRSTRHSLNVATRFLAYIHPPRKTRVAPQVLLRYDRQWSDAGTVGVLVDDGDPATPSFTVPRIIQGPQTVPTFAVTVPVLVSVQSGKKKLGKVLSQLGFGPAVSYAAAGDVRGYNPFDQVHVVRAETWLYWYPVGKAGEIATSKTNVRVGISPLFDFFVAGRDPGQPRVDYGLLAEIKVGVRGYEY